MSDGRRGAGAYIDDDTLENELLYQSDSQSENDSEEDYDSLRVEDEDWEIAERDFTKHYNRMRQHVAVSTGNASSLPNGKRTAAPLPAINAPSKSIIHAKDKVSDQMASLSKYSSKLSKIDTPYFGVGVNRKGPSATANMKDKSDRATNEQVLDPRTRIILFKMIGRGVLGEINGCVSTGKEANVYHAVAGASFSWPSRPHSQISENQSLHLAVKIYKTSILIFKDRTRYVEGEHRFRRGTNTTNPRKMVRLWAEKELRNLKRLASAGIPCPTPVEVRENVLVMEFLGDSEGWASLRLKDASLPSEASDLTDLYVQLVCLMRRMYQQCKLVHADLSEYNVLYHTSDSEDSTQKPHLIIIDVSQSIESSHPHAWDFLRSDVKNVEDFWARRGVNTLGLRRCFDFVIKENPGCPEDSSNANMPASKPTDDENTLRDWLRQPAVQHDDAEDGNHEDEVFMRSHMPRSYAEMKDPERFIEKQKAAEAASNPQDEINAGAESSDADTESDEESEDVDDANGEEGSLDPDKGETGGYQEHKPRGHRHEDKEAKKERKKAVKAEAQERRKHKIPKAEKKKRIKRAQRG